MPTYNVTGSFRGSFDYTIVADSEDQARELAYAKIDESDIDDYNPVEVNRV